MSEKTEKFERGLFIFCHTHTHTEKERKLSFNKW